MSERLRIFRERLRALNLYGMLILQTENRRYLSGYTGSDGYLLITAKDAVLAVDSRFQQQAYQETTGFEIVRIIGEPEKDFETLLDRFAVPEEKLTGHSESILLGAPRMDLESSAYATEAGDRYGGLQRRFGFEADTVTVGLFNQIRPIAGQKGIAFLAQADLVEPQRCVKDPAEIMAIEEAIALTDVAFTNLVAVLRPGMTEKEAAWVVEKYVRENGGDALAFETIIGSGPNAALPHAVPTDKRIVEGETIVIDMGARIAGYNADLTRTVCLGEPPSELSHIYDVVLAAQEAAVTQIRPGMTGAEADAIARQIIDASGYGQYFGHSLGHGVGLAVHEAPRLGRSSTQVLGPGAVFTIEPGIYLPEVGGVRIEDTVTLTPTGVRVLSQAEKRKRLGSKA